MGIMAVAGLVILFLALAAVALAAWTEKHAPRNRAYHIEQARHRVLDEMSALRRQAEDDMFHIILNRRRQ